jgi:hypothetical protein
MTFHIVYLIGYFALLGGAGFVLWQSGLMRELPEMWVAVAFIAAAALGLLLGVLSYPRTARTTGTEHSDF